MTPLDVIQDKQKRGCHRCGHCCEALPLNFSPQRIAWAHVFRVSDKMAPEIDGEPDWLDNVFMEVKYRRELKKGALKNPSKKRLVSFSGIERDPSDRADDILEIAIMIEGRYHGHQTVPCDRHVFGPCNHLRRDENGLASCAIHATKPYMCRVYPYNQLQEKFLPNPSYIKGCGYNTDPAVGLTPSDIIDLAKP